MTEMTKNPTLRALANELMHTPIGMIATYFVASIVLASVIWLRLNEVLTFWTTRLNVLIYFFTYYMVSMVSILWLFLAIHQRSGKKLTNKTLGIVIGETLLCTFALMAVFILTNLPDYLIMPLPLIIVSAVYLFYSRKLKKPIKLVAPLLAAMFAISFFLPIVTASLGNQQILDQASQIQDKEEQVRFISNIILSTTVRMDIVRANNDFQKLIIAGDGACGEGTHAIATYLRELGYSVREAGFPGEDHAFAEVMLNGTWKVIDPGYYQILTTEEARGESRVTEAGTLTYAAAYSNNGFTELTEQFVNTDTIKIRITQNGEPLAGVSITLVHKLVTDGNARNMELPGNGFAFHTDINGTIGFHLGKIEPNVYNGSFAKTDPFYTIYINGKPTQQKVTSTGTGATSEISIDPGL